jgi:alpha-mannosidase
VPINDVVSVEVVDDGPLAATVHVVRRTRSSSFVQTIGLHAGSPLVRCRLEADWHERHQLLKVAFPVDVRAPRASFEIQFGHLARPTHRNTSWDAARFEVCAQRWADLSEGGYGVALLNANRNGYDVHGSTLRLSLLRAATWPDPEADQGHHVVDYALYPHAGDLVAADVPGVARCFHRPLRLVAGAVGEGAVLASSSDPGAVIETLKPAEDGVGVVARVYEGFGGRRRAALRFGFDVREVVPVDLHERPVGEALALEDAAVEVELAPFEIRTLRLRLR